MEQFIRYFGVGLIMLGFSICSFYLTLEVLQLPLYPTYVALHIIATGLSYLLNTKFTFRQKRKLDEGIKYYLVYMMGLVIGLILLWIFDHLFDVTNFVLTLMVIVPRTLITYTMTNLFVYKNLRKSTTD